MENNRVVTPELERLRGIVENLKAEVSRAGVARSVYRSIWQRWLVAAYFMARQQIDRLPGSL